MGLFGIGRKKVPLKVKEVFAIQGIPGEQRLYQVITSSPGAGPGFIVQEMNHDSKLPKAGSDVVVKISKAELAKEQAARPSDPPIEIDGLHNISGPKAYVRGSFMFHYHDVAGKKPELD